MIIINIIIYIYIYGNILNYMEIHGKFSTRNSYENRTYWYVNVSNKNWGSGFQLQTYGGTGLTKTKLEK